LSVQAEAGGMYLQLNTDPQALMREILRYLAAVDVFRAEQCEPTWLPELVSLRVAESQTLGLAKSVSASDKHLH
jgi:hypothetical protein